MEEKYLIWLIDGGLGKNVAATSLCKDIKQTHPDRVFILLCTYPDVFTNNPYIDRVFGLNKLSYFYETYIQDKDTLIFRQDPYHQSGHIINKDHIIKSWCDILGLSYTNQQPDLYLNYAQKFPKSKYLRNKPLLLLQTTSGQFYKNDGTLEEPYHWQRDIPYELATYIVQKYSSRYHIIHFTTPGGYTLEGVERLDKDISFTEMCHLLLNSSKRILINSVLQHIAPSFNLPSDVIWIGSSPEVYGYKIHNNILPISPKIKNHLVNSIVEKFHLGNNELECPYNNLSEMFNIQEVLNRLED